MLDLMFSDAVRVESMAELVSDSDLYSEEKRLIENASHKRKMEFAAGRSCAKKALSHFGVKNFPILVGRCREPIWPEGYVGSITHCDRYIAAVVARKNHVFSVGVDADVNEKLPAEIVSLICTDDELNYLSTCSEDQKKVGEKLIFSAKESFYKSWYPITQTFIDFKEVTVFLDFEHLSFSVDVSRIKVVEPAFLKVTGRFSINEKHIFTSVVVG